jgi:hypothetical protein
MNLLCLWNEALAMGQADFAGKKTVALAVAAH